ncbi:MAG: family 43 glycosylhydrolase [Deltaproteobacteria bacterium]|nr:family 43 glycosylhydrolase [Deltaproteobacteria bacterium]
MKRVSAIVMMSILATALVSCDKENTHSSTGYSGHSGSISPSGGGTIGLGLDAADTTSAIAVDSGTGQNGRGGTNLTSGTDAIDGSKATGGSSGGSAVFDAANDGANPSGSGGSSGADGSGATGGSDAGGTIGGSGGSSGCTPPPPGSSGRNPLFTDTFTADPAPLVYKCTFFITCGHDEAPAGHNDFVLREWYLLSSTDMVNWDRQVAFGVDIFSWANANAWASQMVERDGTFYWYVPVQKNDGTMAIGVAKADQPEGPFIDAIGRPLVDDDFERSNVGYATPRDTPFTIDPTVFIDGDGRAYMLYGCFGRMINAELNSDMISIKGTMVESTPMFFFEAPFLTRRADVYYVVYAARQNPATIDYATSDSPLGPWIYGGQIMDSLPNNPGENYATSHPGIAEFAGKWYLVYHLSHGTASTYRRQVAVEKLTFNADGSIQEVVPSSGLQF